MGVYTLHCLVQCNYNSLFSVALFILNDFFDIRLRMNATKPLEYVCFFPASIPTKEGDAYVFLSVDVFSDFAFNTGVETNDNPENIFKHIYLLTEHPAFAKHIKTGFTLVLQKYKELEPRITNIIKPINGKVVFDGEYVNKIMMPVLKDMFRNIDKRL